MTIDTVPRHIRDMAIDWLADNNLPFEWEDSVAKEFAAAIADRQIDLVRTHEQGRPYDTPLVEWEHRDDEAKALAEQEGLADRDEARQAAQEFYDATHPDCIPLDDAREAAQR